MNLRWLFGTRQPGMAEQKADAYREVSIAARVAVALLCFERYCQAKRLRHPLIDTFLDRMWELPCIESLAEWEARPCELVHAGLGDSFSPEVVDLLGPDKVFRKEFRELLESTVEVVYCSAYGKGDDEGSLRFLNRVLCICSAASISPPPVEPFSMSLFAENDGWGKRLSTEQRDAWRFKAYGSC